MNPENAPKTNVFFRLTAVATVLFAMTVLALTATLFGDSRAPIHGFLSHYGGMLIAGEVAVALSCGFVAMAIDRRGIVENAANRTDEFAAAEPRHAIEESRPMGDSVSGGDNS